VRGHVIQDLAALNKMELLLWDVSGLMQAELDTGVALVDAAACGSTRRPASPCPSAF